MPKLLTQEERRASRERWRGFNRDYFRLVRRAKFPPHQYVRQTHCADCRREYNRKWMWNNRWDKNHDAYQEDLSS